METLDGEIDRLSQQFQDLAKEKATLVECLELRGCELTTKVSKWKSWRLIWPGFFKRGWSA